MATSSRVRKRQYEAAVKREAYLNRVDRPVKEGVSKRPKTSVIYSSYLLKTGGNVSQLLSIEASERSLLFFTKSTASPNFVFTDPILAPLGLKATASITDAIVSAPRHWTPAKVHAGIGLTTPTAKRSAWGTRVVKSKSANYSAPISATVANVTYDILDSKTKSLFDNLKTQLGDTSYASFYLSPELFIDHKI